MNSRNNATCIFNKELTNGQPFIGANTKSLPRNPLRSLPNNKQNLSTSSSESDIFTIYNQSNVTNSSPRLVRRHISQRCQPPGYTRHNNLDVQPLSLADQLKLARIHYLNIHNIIRFCTVTFCLGWFIFVATTTLTEYNNHDTVVFLDYTSPNVSRPPSITICTHPLIDSFPDSVLPQISARNLMKVDDLQDLLRQSKNDSRSNLVAPKVNLKIICTLRPSIRKKGNIWKYDRNCTDLVPVLRSLSEGRVCHTFFSDIYGQTTRALQTNPELQLEFDQFPRIYVQVSGKYLFGVSTSIQNGATNPNKSLQQKYFSGVYVALHGADILPHQLNSALHQLTPGKVLVMPFIKRVQTLLKPPYQTNCYEYDSKYKLTVDGPSRSKGECIIRCMWNMLSGNQCAHAYSIYTEEMVTHAENRLYVKEIVKMIHNDKIQSKTNDQANESDFYYKICPKNNNSFYEYGNAKEQCVNNCPDSCEIETFEEDKIFGADLIEQNQYAGATIMFASEPVTYIVHRPKFEDILALLGGELHIWLGISVVNIIWYLIKLIRSGEIIPNVNIYYLVRWFRNK